MPKPSNPFGDIFFITTTRTIKRRRTHIEVLDAKLKPGWNCEGETGDYSLWNNEEIPGVTEMYDTVAEVLSEVYHRDIMRPEEKAKYGRAA